MHFCPLKAEKINDSFNGKKIRPVISKSITELGLTAEQALEICNELNNHKTIAAWLTGSLVGQIGGKEVVNDTYVYR